MAHQDGGVNIQDLVNGCATFRLESNLSHLSENDQKAVHGPRAQRLISRTRTPRLPPIARRHAGRNASRDSQCQGDPHDRSPQLRNRPRVPRPRASSPRASRPRDHPRPAGPVVRAAARRTPRHGHLHGDGVGREPQNLAGRRLHPLHARERGQDERPQQERADDHGSVDPADQRARDRELRGVVADLVAGRHAASPSCPTRAGPARST